VSDDDVFRALRFHWDRPDAMRPVDTVSVDEVLADFDRGMAGHVWAAAVLEGNPFTYPEVQTLLDGVTVGGHKVSDAQQILRLRDGHALLRDTVASGTFALNKATSDALHAVIATGEALESGHFRGEGAATSDVAVNLGERGTHFPPPTQAGGENLRMLYASALQSLEACDAPFEKAAAYFLFAADNQFYFDGNKRTARAMMNGLLLAAGVHAVLVPAQAREEFNETMRDFYADRDATAAMALLGSCGPRVDETRQRLIQINRTLRNDG
jgi:Fic family protein